MYLKKNEMAKTEIIPVIVRVNKKTGEREIFFPDTQGLEDNPEYIGNFTISEGHATASRFWANTACRKAEPHEIVEGLDDLCRAGYDRDKLVVRHRFDPWRIVERRRKEMRERYGRL